MSAAESSSEVDNSASRPRGRFARFRSTAGQWVGITTLLAALAALSFELPTALSGNGHFTVYFSEPASLVLFVALLVAAITSHYRPSVWAKRMLMLLAAFCVWYVIASLARLSFGGNVKQSLLVIRTTILPLAAYFVVDARWDNRRRVLTGMVLFNAAIVLLHLPEWYNLRMSAYLGNSIVFDTLVILLVPLNMLICTGRYTTSGVVRFIAAFNILAALVLPLWTGSRSAVGMVAIAFVGSLVALRPSREAMIRLGATTLLALVVHGAVWLVNPQGVAYGIYRLVPTPGQVAAATGLDFLKPYDTADREDHANVAADELAKSDESRAELMQLALEEIRKQPVFGSGQVYFEIESYRGLAQYSAHNFILDHLNAYGSPGLVLYLGFFVILLAPKIRNWRPGMAGFTDNATSLITTATLMGVSLTQPTMMIPVVITTYYVTISGLQASDESAVESGSIDEEGGAAH